MESTNHVSPKRLVKLGISLGVYVAFEVGKLLRRLTDRTPRGACVVVYYHSVSVAERPRFAKQLDSLMSYAKPIAINRDISLAPGVRYAAITFDDGYKNFYECALPELAKRGIPSTMFVISDVIGKSHDLEGRSEEIMSLEQIRALPEDLVTIGSHTLTHPLLPSINIGDATREIILSRVQLEEKLNRQILLFSFPYGCFNERLTTICREAGYRRVFSTLPYCAFRNVDEFVTGRVRVDPTDWALEFRLKLAGAYRWLPWAFELKRRVIGNIRGRGQHSAVIN